MKTTVFVSISILSQSKEKGSTMNAVNIYENLLSEVVKSDWVKTGPKHWSHVSGVQVKYDCNAWKWQVIGGANCGRFYTAKWEAQTEAVKSGKH